MKTRLLRSSALALTASLALGTASAAAVTPHSPVAHAAKKKTKKVKKKSNAQLRWMEKQIGPKKSKGGKGKRSIVASAASVTADFEQLHKEGALNLVRSYEIPAGDPNENRMANLSWTYDSAISAAAFTSAGDTDSAGKLLEQLAALQNKDGSIAFAFNTASGAELTQYRAGTVAWLGLAATFYHQSTCSTQFDSVAVKATQWLLTQQGRGLGGLVAGGPDVEWSSTQNNVLTRMLYSRILDTINNGKCPLDLTMLNDNIKPNTVENTTPVEASPDVLVLRNEEEVQGVEAIKEKAVAEDASDAAKAEEAKAVKALPAQAIKHRHAPIDPNMSEKTRKKLGIHEVTQEEINEFYGVVKGSMYSLDERIEKYLFDGGYRFRQGVEDETTPLDAQTYGAMWLNELGRSGEALRVVQYAVQTMFSPNQSIVLSKDIFSWNTAYSSDRTYQGLRPYAGAGTPDVIWMEGTYQARYAAAQNGWVDGTFEESLSAWSKLTYPAGPLQASATVTGNAYNEYHVWPSAAAAAWAQLSAMNSNFVR